MGAAISFLILLTWGMVIHEKESRFLWVSVAAGFFALWYFSYIMHFDIQRGLRNTITAHLVGNI
jgi:hypothetical protein